MVQRRFHAFQVLRLQHVIKHRLYALHKRDAFRVGVEAAGVLGVEQLNGSGGIAPVAGRSVDTDCSNAFAVRTSNLAEGNGSKLPRRQVE